MFNSMVRQALLLSFTLSLLSLCIVLYSPLEIEIRDKDRIYSPYREELDLLRSKAESGMKPKEYQYYESLIEKNNRWFEEEKKNHDKWSATSALKAWRKKSDFLAPGIMILWGLAFYFYFKQKPKKQALLVLTFPALLTVAGLMSLLESVLIAFTVLVIWFLWLIRGQIE